MKDRLVMQKVIIVFMLTFFVNFAYTKSNQLSLEVNQIEANTVLAFNQELEAYNNYYTKKAEIDGKAYLLTGTSTLLGLMMIGVGILYTLPTSFTGWEKAGLSEDLQSAGSNWVDNVTHMPVWDNDNLFLNYVTHPYWGAVYYIQARNAGYDEFQSFLFSAFTSTVMWEYGVEAFAEAPSIQDLLITPILGSLLGEQFYHLSNKIKENNDKVYNSKLLGYTVLTMMDPLYLILNKTALSQYTIKDANNQAMSYSGWGFSGNSIILRMSIPIN